MPVTHRMEWNGQNWIVVLENGHDRIDITLDDLLQMVDGLKADLLLDPSEPQPPAPRRPA